MYDADSVKTHTNCSLGIPAIHSSLVLNQVANLLYDEKKSAGPQETHQAMQRGRSGEATWARLRPTTEEL